MKPLSGALIDYRQKDTLQGQTTYQKISKIEQWVKKSEKGDICLPFCEKKKKLCPCALTLKRQMHQKGQSFINFSEKSSRHTISKGKSKKTKGQHKNQKRRPLRLTAPGPASCFLHSLFQAAPCPALTGNSKKYRRIFLLRRTE